MLDPDQKLSAESALKASLPVDRPAASPMSQEDLGNGSEQKQLPAKPRRKFKRLNSTLNENNFDKTTGMPDMDGIHLRASLRSLFDPEGSSPEDFPKAARMLLRKQTRGCVTPDPEPVTELEESSARPISQGSNGESSNVALAAVGTSLASLPAQPGGESFVARKLLNRRISEPVLALSREALSAHASSQVLQTVFWRQWQQNGVKLKHSDSGSGFSDVSELEEGKEKDEVTRETLPPPCSKKQEETLSPTPLPQKGEGPESEVARPSSPKSTALVLRDAVREALDESIDSRNILGSSEVHDLKAALCPDSAAQWRQPDNVLILVDWDDTILPTTWLAARPWFRNWVRSKGPVETALEGADEKDREALAQLDLAACSFIQEACHLGRPFCVTLAQRPWVERSMQAILPQLAKLWEDHGLTASYAEEEVIASSERTGGWCKKPCRGGQLENAVFEFQMRSDQKRKVMHRLLRNFYKKTDNIWLNVVSFGDGAAERSALQEIAFWHENPPSPESGEPLDFRVKSVQLFEEPECSQLTGQLNVLQEWLPVLVGLDQDLDAVLGIGDDEDVRVANNELLELAGSLKETSGPRPASREASSEVVGYQLQ